MAVASISVSGLVTTFRACMLMSPCPMMGRSGASVGTNWPTRAGARWSWVCHTARPDEGVSVKGI